VARETQPGFAVWITGLPASGKSMLAAALVEELKRRELHVTVLESDVLRKSFSAPTSYDERDRDYFYGSLAFIGQVLTQLGVNVILDATANKRAYRDRARQRIPRFLEIHVDTPLDVCMRRDPKGIYEGGKAGLSQNVPGLQAEYEPPLNPDLIVHGDKEPPEAAAEKVIKLLESRRMIDPTTRRIR
jgi:adenylylsulfate kinase